MAEQDLSKLKIDRSQKTQSRFGKSRRFSRKLAIGGAVAIVALLIVYFSKGFGGAVEVEQASVTTAYPSQGFTVLNATGYVVAQRKAAVASKATGRLEWLGVAEGSQVKMGDVIAKLESGDVSAVVAQADAALGQSYANLTQSEAEMSDAEASLKRSQELLDKKFISPAAHDAAIARYRKAKAGVRGAQSGIGVSKANLDAAKIAVEYTHIRAPFDGVVLTKNANIGDVVTPFSSAIDAKGAVVTMADMSTLEVEADVSESNLQKVKLEQPCEIQLDALPENRFRGMVHRIVPTVDRSKATVMVKIRFLEMDPRVLPDMSAKVGFLSKEVGDDQRKARTAVQPNAVVLREGKNVVFVVKDNVAHMVPVTTGENIGEMVEIIEGVSAGERIVLRPPEKLREGASVKSLQK